MLAVFLLALLCTAHSTFIAEVTNNIDLHESPEVNIYRSMVIRDNHQVIQAHNANPDRTFDMKPYPMFIRYTVEEIGSRLLNRGMSDHKDPMLTIQAPPAFILKSKSQLFTSNHQVKKTFEVILNQNLTLPMYNQGACGNCYAIAIADAFHISWILQTFPNFPAFSSQQLTECTSDKSIYLPYYNSGCLGGYFGNSLYYINKYGLSSMYRYPTREQTVKYRKIQNCTKTDYYKLGRQTHYDFMSYELGGGLCGIRLAYLANKFTTVTALYSANHNFIYYKKGYIDKCPYTASTVHYDHAVVLVGMKIDTDTNLALFKGKNSWGVGWGIDGYFWIQANNACNSCMYSFSFSYIINH